MLSKQVTIGRNSRFYNLTAEDEEKLGGIEYRASKLLLKIAIGTRPPSIFDCGVCVINGRLVGYFFGLHLFGAICLIPWIHRAPAKYTDWLAANGQNKTWW